MYGTTYVMYVCATAFCGSWKSSYIHEGGGNCFDVLYFGLHIVDTEKKQEILLNIKRQRAAWLWKTILTGRKISSIHITSSRWYLSSETSQISNWL